MFLLESISTVKGWVLAFVAFYRFVLPLLLILSRLVASFHYSCLFASVLFLPQLARKPARHKAEDPDHVYVDRETARARGRARE